MSVADHEAAQRLIAQYEALEPTRKHIQELYDSANEGLIPYDEPDELSADVNEMIRDIADEALPLLKRLAFR